MARILPDAENEVSLPRWPTGHAVSRRSLAFGAMRRRSTHSMEVGYLTGVL